MKALYPISAVPAQGSKYDFMRVDLISRITDELNEQTFDSERLPILHWLDLAARTARMSPKHDWIVAFFLSKAANLAKSSDSKTIENLAFEIELASVEFN